MSACRVCGQFEYEMILILDLGKALPPVDELVNELNATLSAGGVDEKVKCEGRVSAGVVTVKRQMDEGELEQMRSIIHAEFLTSELSFAKSIQRVELVRRQPGKVSQSAS